jgi:hypothetical protein
LNDEIEEKISIKKKLKKNEKKKLEFNRLFKD